MIVNCWVQRPLDEASGRAIGIDLSALEGVTVAQNYQEALARFDNGLLNPSTLTVEKFAHGRTMAVNCKRGDDFIYSRPASPR